MLHFAVFARTSDGFRRISRRERKVRPSIDVVSFRRKWESRASASAASMDARFRGHETDVSEQWPHSDDSGE
jgi:hypothetical protein